MKLRRTAWLATAVAAFSLPGRTQEPTPTDWHEVVRDAAEHPRFALRRAAAGKLAKAGDEAVPAIRAYQESAGRNALPLVVVDAIAGSGVAGTATEALLEAWAKDESFYWRSQALGGLAQRAVERVLPVFRRAVDDPSHLYRIEGARGLLAVGDGAADDLRVSALLADADPRTRLRVALMLLEAGKPTGIGEIVAAVDGASRRFLDDAWGAREALFALQELRRLTGHDWTAALDEDPAAQQKARDAVHAWAREQLPSWEPTERAGPSLDAVGGVEVRSCRNGDLFLRWAANGEAIVGLDPVRSARMDDVALAALMADLADITGVATHGTVVCDYLRLYVPARPGQKAEDVHHKAAPSALPPAVHEWLKALAGALDETHGARLTQRLGQFAATDRNR